MPRAQRRPTAPQPALKARARPPAARNDGGPRQAAGGPSSALSAPAGRRGPLFPHAAGGLLLEAPADSAAGLDARDPGREPAALTWTPGPWRRWRCEPRATRRRPSGAPAPGTTRRGGGAAGSGPRHFRPVAGRQRPRRPEGAEPSERAGGEESGNNIKRKGKKEHQTTKCSCERCLGEMG